ncbi:MAG: glucose 1-dehydrogenase [Firmicutes bacterium]|nr:glucose 1-dehydrogenase [Bacillota bacterium]
MRMENKVALITGATMGIGAEAARLFAREGARVVICGRSAKAGQAVADEINEEAGKQAAWFCPLDVTSYESWQRAIDFTLKTCGKLNVLINNAGISFAELIEDTSIEHYEQTIATNQTGVFYGIQLGIRAMKENGEPCAIVSTSSVDGVTGDPLFTPYCAAKAAVVAMTKCAAIECGQKGYDIRVNAVAPGYIESPMYALDAEQRGMTYEEYTRDMTALHPIGRIGKAEDIARAYLYLASDEAGFVTGTTLMVDGGYTAW